MKRDQAAEAKRAKLAAAKALRSEKRRQMLDARPLVNELPFEIDNIELTNRCPMRCVMCPRTHHMTRSQGYMDFEVFTRVIDELAEVNPQRARSAGVYLHHFGESLMHPEFARFIKYANDRGVVTRISINPLMLKERLTKQLLDANPTHLLFSLDGHDDESFYRIRGVKNAYTLSKERLLAFLEQKRHSNCTSNTALLMIDFAENRESIEAMKEFWGSVEGLGGCNIKTFTTWDGSAPEINDYSAVVVDNVQARANHKMPTCTLPWRRFTVTWDGDVVPCCYDFDKKIVLGNLSEQSLLEIWNGPRMQELRREFLSNNVENSLCRDCSKLYG